MKGEGARPGRENIACFPPAPDDSIPPPPLLPSADHMSYFLFFLRLLHHLTHMGPCCFACCAAAVLAVPWKMTRPGAPGISPKGKTYSVQGSHRQGASTERTFSVALTGLVESEWHLLDSRRSD